MGGGGGGVVFVEGVDLPGEGEQAEVALAVEAEAGEPAGLVWFEVDELGAGAAPVVDGDEGGYLYGVVCHWCARWVSWVTSWGRQMG